MGLSGHFHPLTVQPTRVPFLVRTKFFFLTNRPDWPWGPSSLLWTRSMFLFPVKRPGLKVNHWCSSTADIRVYPLFHLYALWHGYSNSQRSVWSGYWIRVCMHPDMCMHTDYWELSIDTVSLLVNLWKKKKSIWNCKDHNIVHIWVSYS